MITVELNEANFEYDIHSLVKAFYPGHDVLVKAQPRENFPDSLFHLTVRYGENEILFTFYRGKQWEEKGEAPDDQGDPDHAKASVGMPEQTEMILLQGRTQVNPADRRETKDRLKRKLYELLSDFCGQTLPWGTLTGIRPTKIPMTMLEDGCSEDEIRKHMKESYFTSDEKIGLSIEVAKRELELLSRIDYENGYSLYVGIPFCPSTCLYCSFASYPISAWKNRVDEYLDALCREIEATAGLCKDKYLNAVYIGGGTPTSLEPAQLERLICQIGESFHLFDEKKHIVYGGLEKDGDALISHGFDGNPRGEVHPMNHLLEFTVEAGRPDSITREKLQVLRDHNISRISINPQTMKEETLRLIGRHHTAQQTKESFALAREMGFDNINMDLIVGLPEESIEDVKNTMEELTEMAPDNVTVHSLAVKRAARLKMQWEEYEHLHMENTWDIIRLTADYCRRMGLEPYYLYRQKNMAGNFENVGYAARGKAGVYNILIMEEKQTIMALGAGATTKVVTDHGQHIERVGNVKDITNYLERVDEMIERKANLLKKCGCSEAAEQL